MSRYAREPVPEDQKVNAMRVLKEGLTSCSITSLDGSGGAGMRAQQLISRDVLVFQCTISRTHTDTQTHNHKCIHAHIHTYTHTHTHTQRERERERERERQTDRHTLTHTDKH